MSDDSWVVEEERDYSDRVYFGFGWYLYTLRARNERFVEGKSDVHAMKWDLHNCWFVQDFRYDAVCVCLCVFAFLSVPAAAELNLPRLCVFLRPFSGCRGGRS